MAIISANLQFNRGGHGLLDYSGFQANYSAALAWAKDVNSNAAVGQYIYLGEAETIEGVEYAKGPYIVDAIGENAVLTPLSKSVAGSPDLAGTVSDLQSEVGNVKTDVQGVKDSLATTDASVNAIEEVVNKLDETYATKAEVEEAIGDIDFSALATKTEVEEGLAAKADASVVYTKDEVDAAVSVKADASVVYTKDEVDAAISTAIDAIPAVDVPFQSVAEGDKVLKLDNGVLSSELAFAREEVEGIDSIVLKGQNGEVIGTVPVADFIVDGMLKSVEPIEGENGKFRFTFSVDADGDQKLDYFDVDFSKFIDVYHADDVTLELDSATNTFKVKDGVFEAAGAAADVQADLDAYVERNDAAVAEKLDASVYNDHIAVVDGSIAAIEAAMPDFAKTADVEAGYVAKEDDKVLVSAENVEKLEGLATINSVEGDLTLTDGKLSVDLSGYVAKEDGKGLSTNDFSDDEKAKLEGIEAGAQVNFINEVGDNLSVEDGKLSVDLSVFAKSSDVADNYVAKEGYVAYSDEEKSKLAGIAEGAEVNYVKSVGDNLSVDDAGKLSVDLSAKLDASAKVNGLSFVNGEVNINGEHIALGAAITRTAEDGSEENVYEATSSIQSVLASLSQRIDVLDPNVSGELGITSITAGEGISTNVSGGQATIAVKVSENDGNVAVVKTDGIYVADMRSYWSAI